MLTKKHFEELARIVYEARHFKGDQIEFVQGELERFCRAHSTTFDI